MMEHSLNEEMKGETLNGRKSNECRLFVEINAVYYFSDILLTRACSGNCSSS